MWVYFGGLGMSGILEMCERVFCYVGRGCVVVNGGFRMWGEYRRCDWLLFVGCVVKLLMFF